MRHMIAPVLPALALLAGCPATASGDGRPETVLVPAGAFVVGSAAEEREAAYRLDETAYGHSVTRRQGWYEAEPSRHEITIGRYRIMTAPVSNTLYARFVSATGHPAPDVDEATWESYGLIHPWPRTRRHAWQAARPPPSRDEHPVVLVSHRDAVAFAAWLSGQTGEVWRLPTEAEWEKAARGTDGRRFPWGDAFDPSRLNSADAGPFDTVPVGSHPAGASPFGVLDAAGQVYEWTATMAAPGRYIVKGGSWDDKGCGVCRPAARHSRPAELRHIIVGFRLVREVVR